MQPLTKFVKGNLVPLVCGLVVLLSIGAIFWPIGSWKNDLQTQMLERYNQVGLVDQLKANIQLPSGTVLQGATYESNVIAAAADQQKKMAAQAAEIKLKAGEQNQHGRVVPGAGGKLIPLLAGKPEDNFLPKINSAAGALPYTFMLDYNHIFKDWTTQLAGTDAVPPIPPTLNEISAEFTAEQKRAAQPIKGAPMFAGEASEAPVGAPDATYIRAAISRRASQLHMYVDAAAFYKATWASGAIPPNESQIFEGIVSSWFEQDFINAILEVNKGSANVGTSPVKRLERLTVGIPSNVLSAAAPGASLFASLNSTAPPPPTGMDPNRDLTGRVGNADYDVVVSYIGLDLDPAYENAFIAALYKQNNGYTVLNINTRVLDPFETSANGYLYGNVQVVHLDIMVEGLMYRSWTVPLMPDYIRHTLSLPPLPTTP